MLFRGYHKCNISGDNQASPVIVKKRLCMLSKIGGIVCLLMILASARRVQQTGLGAQTVRSQPSNPSEKLRDEILAKVEQAYRVFVGGGYLQAEKVFEQAWPAGKTLGYSDRAVRRLTYCHTWSVPTTRAPHG